jgi:hypothetical protein
MYFLNSFLGNYYCKQIIALKVKTKGKPDTIQLFVHEKLRVQDENNTKLQVLPLERFSKNDQTGKVDLINKINIIYFSNAVGVKAFWGNSNQLDVSTSFIFENLNNGQVKTRKLKFMDSFRLGELKKQINFIERYGEDFEKHFGNRLIKIGGYFNSIGGAEVQKMLSELHLNREFIGIAEKSFSSENNSSWHTISNPELMQVYLGLMIIMNSGNKINFNFQDLRLSEILPKIEERLTELNLMNEKNFFSFIKNLDSKNLGTLINISEQYVFIDPFSIQFEIGRTKFKTFLELYEKTLKDEDHLAFSWNLSSGENAYLNIFSRIYDLERTGKIDKQYPIWLLLDEGELYLHPQWQKSFTKNIIYFMSKIFGEFEFQMIFTSHSPLILSDFPKESIIFIERTDEGMCKISDMKSHEATFASNIYELYKDSFFLQGAFFGEYAEDEINKIISYLSKTQGSEVKKTEKDRMKFIIQSIGDEVFKNKLLEVWNDRNKNDLIQHDKD